MYFISLFITEQKHVKNNVTEEAKSKLLHSTLIHTKSTLMYVH